MTDEEYALAISLKLILLAKSDPEAFVERLSAVVHDAVAQEREACAKIVDDHETCDCACLATAIRKRGKP